MNINYPADIEGLWTYIHYSYSFDLRKAVALVKYGDDKNILIGAMNII